METLRAAFALTRKDLLSWFRTPMHVLISFAPIVIMMILLALFFASGYSMPVAVVMDSPDDPLSRQFVDTVENIGTINYPWFEVKSTDRQHAEELFQKNKLLAIIEVPDITAELKQGKDATVRLRIANLNDDLTKNFRQRVQEACLVFIDRLQPQSIVPVASSIRTDFSTFLPEDLGPLVFLGAGLVALAIVMGGIVNASSLVAREFEENTFKELLLAPSTVSIIMGKWASALVQTCITVGIIWLLAVPVCGFIPQGSLLPLLLLVLVGTLSFAGLGTLLGLYFKEVVPAGIAGLLFAIIGWWFGGLIWADIWPDSVQGIVAALPPSYLERAFTRAALLDLHTTYWFDVMVLLLFGLITAALAYLLLKRKRAL